MTILLVLFTLAMAFFIWGQWTAMKKALHADTLLRLRDAWESKEMIEARKAVWDYKDGASLAEAIETAEKANSQLYYLLSQVAFFFEDVGLLVKKGYVEKKPIIELIPDQIIAYYERYRQWIETEGKPPSKSTDPGYFFYWLYKETKNWQGGQ